MKRILVIDDDKKLNQLLKDYLVKFDLEVISETDPLKGLKTLKKTNPDLVILDVMMPGMDGFEVCRKIRNESLVPVIIITARGEETDRVIGLELGADDYVCKPFSMRELLARVKAVLRRQQAAAGEVDQNNFAAGSLGV